MQSGGWHRGVSAVYLSLSRSLFFSVCARIVSSSNETLFLYSGTRIMFHKHVLFYKWIQQNKKKKIVNTWTQQIHSCCWSGVMLFKFVWLFVCTIWMNEWVEWMCIGVFYCSENSWKQKYVTYDFFFGELCFFFHIFLNIALLLELLTAGEVLVK